jgi:ribonucleoside-diphosphate reductase alpha chain
MVLMKGTDAGAEMVRAGGGRRAANMFSLDITHPNVVEFVDVKKTKGLSNANISVRSKKTRAFVKAIEEDGDWELSWKGKYKKVIKARDLWNRMVQNAWHSAEPGILNMELALEESTIYYIEELVTTNPCGEIFLTAYGNCCLGHLVLPRYVEDGEVNWSLIGEVVSTGVRFLDNVLDVNSYPLPEMKAASQKFRRIGLGCTGLADMLVMLDLKYGSDEANKFIDKLYRFISKAAYEASILLAVEKGAFPACDPELHVKSGFVTRMPNKVKSRIREHGIRNCALLTQAPVGTGSILSNNVTSGVEPMIGYAYWRNFFKGEERATELCFHPLFDEYMKAGKSTEHFVATADLSIRQHLEVQRIIQTHTDNAVSKTVNFPEFYPVEELAKAWLEYLPLLKGTTFYRENSRKYILKDGTEAPPPIVAIPYDEALRMYRDDQLQKAIEAAEADDCSKGYCEKK